MSAGNIDNGSSCAAGVVSQVVEECEAGLALACPHPLPPHTSIAPVFLSDVICWQPCPTPLPPPFMRVSTSDWFNRVYKTAPDWSRLPPRLQPPCQTFISFPPFLQKELFSKVQHLGSQLPILGEGLSLLPCPLAACSRPPCYRGRR